MISKYITYTDYNGVEHTEEFLFHLSKKDLLQMQVSVDGGMAEHLSIMLANKDEMGMLSFLVDLILKAYGEKSADGKRFVKSPEISEAFMQTPAFDALFDELTTKDGAIETFITSLMPTKTN